MTVHRNLTGADLHEPKGVETALSGMVYVANGSGSGVWTSASSIITNTAFTTGDTKTTFKNVADSGWIMWAEGSIGDGSSSASLRANADTAALFTLFWTNYNNVNAPVSGGRGASAAADYAAHKTITLPLGVGRAIGVAGTASGLTARPYGTIVGAESHAILVSEVPSLTATGVNSISVTSSTFILNNPFGNTGSAPGGGTQVTASDPGSGGRITTVTSTGNNSITVNYTNGSPTLLSLMQPTVYMNVMIKL